MILAALSDEKQTALKQLGDMGIAYQKLADYDIQQTYIAFCNEIARLQRAYQNNSECERLLSPKNRRLQLPPVRPRLEPNYAGTLINSPYVVDAIRYQVIKQMNQQAVQEASDE